MAPGVASVMVQVLTGDADAKLKHLGDTAIGQASRMEAAFGKAGQVMGASMADAASATDVAVLSNKEYQESLVALEKTKLQLWNTTLKTAADTEAAEARVTAAVREQGKVRQDVALKEDIISKERMARADAAVRASERELAAAKRAAGIKPAQVAQYEAAGATAAAARVTATREAEAQLALSARNAEAYAKQKAALQNFASFGGKALAGLAAASVVVGVEAVKMGIGFENAQKKFEGATGRGERGPTGGRALSAQFERSTGKQQSGQELEGAYATVAKQVEVTQHKAIGAGEAYKFMTAASNLQVASGEKLSNVTNDLASVMQVYKIKMGDAAETSNKMFNASRLVNTSVDSMTSLVTKLHARLGDIGGGLNSVLGLMTEAASFGLTGGRGVLIFNQALERLTSSSKPVTQVLESLNVHLHNSKNEFVGMPSVVEQLHGAYQKLTPAQREFATQQLFGKGATGEFTEIIRNGKSGLEQFTAASLKHGEVERAAQKANESFTGQLKIMWANIQTAGGALGHALIPELKDLAGALGASAEWLSKNNGAALALAGVIVTVLGASMGAFVATKIAGMISGLQAMGTAMVSLVTTADATAVGVDAALVGTGIGATVVALGFTVLALKDHWKEVMTGLEEMAQSAANGVIGAFNEIIHAANEIIGTLSLGLIPKIKELKELSGAGESSPAMKGTSEAELKKQGLGGWDKNIAGSGFTTASQEGKQGGIMAYFIGKGLSPAQAAGIAGNWQQESSLDPTTNTSEGTGLASWTKERITALKAFAKSEHKPWTDTGVQLNFAWKEMKERGTVGQLAAGKSDPSKAAELFNKAFEGGTDPGGIRERYAREAFGLHPQTKKHLTELRAQGEYEEGNGEGNALLQALKNEKEHGKHKESEAQKEAKAKAKKQRKEETEGSINPFAFAHGLTQTREDMGLDYSMKVGDKIVAPGAGEIDAIVQNWYRGQPLVEEKITSGKDRGMYFYVAEQIKAAVQKGQKVKAGQTLGMFAASGTGVEAGLGAGGGQTLAQSRGEFHDHPGNDPTRASAEFKRFLSGLGKGLGGAGGALEQSGANTAFAKAIKAFETLTKTGTTVFKKYEEQLQSGTVRTLEKLTGYTAQDPTGKHSVQYAQLQTTVGALQASGQTELANKLVTVHREALKLLRESITAQGREREAQKLGVETTHMKDLADDAKKTAEAGITIQKDRATQAADASKAASQAMADAAAEFRAKTDVTVTELADAAKQMSEEFSGAAQQAKDVSDIKVKELEERGKYGLNLQAQREEVALAQMKQSYDQQVEQAKISLDQLRTQEDHLTATDQLKVTQITAKENALVAAAQASLDAEKIAQDTQIQTAQSAVSAAQTHTDIQVGNDLTQAVAEALLGEKRAAQNILKAKLGVDEARGKQEVEAVQIRLGQVQTTASQAIQAKESAYGAAVNTQTEAVAAAQAALSNAEASAKELIARAPEARR